MYNYIFWDLDDTLLDFKRAERAAISSVLTLFGIEPEKEVIELYSNINLSCWKRYEKGEITRQEIYTSRVIMLSEKIGKELDVLKFSNEYFKSLSLQGQTFPFAKELLTVLKEKGYVMAAATNGTATTQINRIANSGLGDFFAGGIFISEQIGFKKPEPQFFEHMIKTMGIENKDKILVIGDSQSSDIKGAVLSGLDSCFVNLKGEKVNKDFKPTYTVNSLEEIIKVCKL